MLHVITGAEGFMGRHVVARLSREGFPLLAVDRVDHAGPVIDGVVYHKADLGDAAALLPDTIPADTPFTLVHLAWDLRRHEGYSNQAEQISHLASLLDCWKTRGLGKVLAMGSAEEYGCRSGKLSEGDRFQNPLSPYGWAKRSSRDLAELWSLRTGIPVIWLRPFIMYGPGQRGDMLIPSALDAARRKQKTPFSDGRQRRDFVHIFDVSDAVALSLRKELTGFSEFNLGRGEEVQIADVLMAIARQFDVESLFELGARARRPGEPDVQIADVTRAAEVLGWRANIAWADGIRQLVELGLPV